MSEERELEYKDTFVLYLQQTLSDRFDAESDFPTLPFADLTTRHQLTVNVNAREYTQIYSAIMTGGDLAFPDIAHELELIWAYAVEAAPMDGTPVGTIAMYAHHTTLPEKWLFCDGSELLIDDYPELYAAFGWAYGSPSDSDHFKLPNLKNRFPYGADDSVSGNEVGNSGGSETHTLTIAEIPAHTHVIDKGVAGNTTDSKASRAFSTASAAQNTQSTGGGESHNNMPPFLRVEYIIKALP